MISTYDLSQLPSIDRLKAISQSLAMLDAILCPEWEYRYYSFDAHWSTDEMMASMRDVSGDSYFLLFSSAGAVLKGFAHEAPMSPYAFDTPHVWPGVLDTLPAIFSSFVREPAFFLEETTFCIWRRYTDIIWHHGVVVFPNYPDPDGSQDLLSILDGNPHTYPAFAKMYYDRPINLDAVAAIYAHSPLTNSIVTALNPNIIIADVVEDCAEIRYPVEEV